MSDDNPSISQNFQKSRIINQAKISSGVMNNELLKNIEVLEEDNAQLKMAVAEVQEYLKDKENQLKKVKK